MERIVYLYFYHLIGVLLMNMVCVHFAVEKRVSSSDYDSFKNESKVSKLESTGRI